MSVKLSDFVLDSEFLPLKFVNLIFVGPRPGLFFFYQVLKIVMLGLKGFQMLRHGHHRASHLSQNDDFAMLTPPAGICK